MGPSSQQESHRFQLLFGLAAIVALAEWAFADAPQPSRAQPAAVAGAVLAAPAVTSSITASITPSVAPAASAALQLSALR